MTDAEGSTIHAFVVRLALSGCSTEIFVDTSHGAHKVNNR